MARTFAFNVNEDGEFKLTHVNGMAAAGPGFRSIADGSKITAVPTFVAAVQETPPQAMPALAPAFSV